MKLHKEIASKYNPVYDNLVAEYLFNDGKISYRRLSLMKQENIRVALTKPGISLETICWALNSSCGYCFEFECDSCPIHKKSIEACDGGIINITTSKTKKEFAERHKEWCEKIGLWEKGWK